MLIGTKHSGYSKANIRLYFDPVTIMAASAAIVPEAAALTAAEVIAAEAAAAAAETLAAQQAAAAVAAETAAITAAEAGALQAAQQAAQAGIMEIGGTTAAQAPLTSEAVQTIAQQAGQNLAPETLTRGIQGVPEVANAPYQFSQAELDALTRGQEIARASSAAPPMEVTAGLNTQGTSLQGSILDKLNSPSSVTDAMLRAGTDPSIPSGVTDSMLRSGFTPPVAAAPPVAPVAAPPVAPVAAPQVAPSGLNGGPPYMPEQPLPYREAMDVYKTPLPDTRSALTKGLDSAMDWAKENKFSTASLAYTGAKALGLLDPNKETFNDKPYDGPLSKYRMSPDFKGRTATPNIYQPTYPTYAAGGIMDAGPVQSMSDQNNAMGYQQAMAATGGQVANFVKGGKTGSLTDSLDYYKDMMGGKTPTAPSDRADVGIFRDSDPDTMYQDALTAAQIRNAKVNKRANLSIPSMKRPTPMGRINLAAPGIKSSGQQEDVQEAAAGGIMGASSLGGYAAGGNPRLLRGPGDGMSDNIPAMIGKKQPARLADGEFVIPADVVSHLGNGSTEAGAKRLHEMMNKVRRDRTGNSKQGKQIVAAKYMPR